MGNRIMFLVRSVEVNSFLTVLHREIISAEVRDILTISRNALSLIKMVNWNSNLSMVRPKWDKPTYPYSSGLVKCVS